MGEICGTGETWAVFLIYGWDLDNKVGHAKKGRLYRTKKKNHKKGEINMLYVGNSDILKWSYIS